ncbi:hypothetical protein [Marinobacter changyiensis]|uniref:hypothetical protein n=1 Tax=Marinobacter changyiensis TaxID=2604091 RepID=UPI00126498D8|nr:hypothetical protein [Marinobacter changyiensis]
MSIPIFFYIPEKKWPDDVPDVYDTRWRGFGEGYYNWTLQTYLLLRDHGIKTELTHDVRGRAGIVISHRALLDASFSPAPDQLLVCIQADWGRHPYAQAHICQNKAQTTREGRRSFYQFFWPANTYFVHHWPQPGLRERNPDRASELNCLSYFGLDYNLTPELRSDDWRYFLSDLDIEWRVVDKMQEWDNFENTDAVLFCRDFRGTHYYNKPATKLYNTWLAQCLPFCTRESAFLDECAKDDPEEAVFINSYEHLKEQVRYLKNNPTRFAQRLDAAKAKAADYTNDQIANEWQAIFDQLRQEDYPKFTNGAVNRWLFLRTRDLSALFLKILGKLTP